MEIVKKYYCSQFNWRALAYFKVLSCKSLHARKVPHPCLHLTAHSQANIHHVSLWDTLTWSISPALWCSLNHRVYFDMQIWPRAFSWPLRRLGWAPEIPPLIWHDLIWWISVLLLLLDVWTHMRGVRLREVFPELLWELMWDNSVPCLEQKRRRSTRRGGKRKRGRWMEWVTVRTERWKKKKQKWRREWGFNLRRPQSRASEESGGVGSTSTTSPLLNLSFSSSPKTSHYCCVGSPCVLTAVLGVLWRQSGGKGVYVWLCVVWWFCSGRGHFGVQHFANIGVCISLEVKPSGWVHVCVTMIKSVNLIYIAPCGPTSVLSVLYILRLNM